MEGFHFHTIYRTEDAAVVKKLFGFMICLLLLCSTTIAEGDENMAKLLYQGHGSLRITTVEGKVILSSREFLSLQ